MNISNENAQKIVIEMSRITSQHLNLIDENGIIIASTDVERINTFHEGAFLIISKRLDELVVHDDNSYKGTKNGVNLPIILDGEIVGVVGITGKYENVARYGQIIQKMTEILLLENGLETQNQIDKRIRERYLDEWIFSNNGEHSNEFIQRGLRIGIDITIPRRVMVLEAPPLNPDCDSMEMLRITDGIDRAIRGILGEIPNSVFAKTSSKVICLIPQCDNKEIRYIAEKLYNTISNRYPVHIKIGVDEAGTPVNRAYAQAKKAAAASKGSSGVYITFYDDINIEVFIDEIPTHLKKEYIEKIFHMGSNEEISSVIALLKIYFETNGSIGQTASRLYVHKNTLQYRLKKLAEQTGKDPRILTDASLFHVAIQFYDSLYSN